MKHTSPSLESHVGEEPRTQYGAICWRKSRPSVDVLLITSRDTGRWVIPKGWPIKGMTGAASAGREAWEEAGVEGKPGKNCLGVFSYQKALEQDQCVPCVVAIYGLQVEKLSRRYPEQRQRQRKWFPASEAAMLVAEPELRALLTAIGDGSLHLEPLPAPKKSSSAGK
jgi:8-oxo-dGTP pyrophosphatase MutT (NUDIX family)